MEKGAKVAAGIAVLAVLVASSASRSGPPTGSGRRGPAPRPTAGSPPPRLSPRLPRRVPAPTGGIPWQRRHPPGPPAPLPLPADLADTYPVLRPRPPPKPCKADGDSTYAPELGIWGCVGGVCQQKAPDPAWRACGMAGVAADATAAARPFGTALNAACDALYYADALEAQYCKPHASHVDDCRNTTIEFDCVGSVGGQRNVPLMNYAMSCFPENN